DYKSSIWAPLPEIDYDARGVTRVERLQRDPVSLLAICAAQEAISNAGLESSLKDKRANTHSIKGLDPSRTGVFMGTGIGGIHSCLENHAYQVLARRKKDLADISADAKFSDEHASSIDKVLDAWIHPLRFNPFVVSMLIPNAVSAILGIKFSINGPNTTYTQACAAGTASIGHAFRAIRSGQVDVALAGGCEYLEDYYGGIFRAFDVQDCQDPMKANRPFDEKRSGFLYSQGGVAVLVLEELQDAANRGAPTIAEITGYAETFDAHSMMSIAADGVQIERMIRLALNDAKIKPANVHYVNAHGTGTETNDAIECEVVERVFGKDVLINSTKSLLGHTFGASGALEAAVTALSLKHRTTHICKNLEEPIADLDFVRSAVSHDIDAAISQSFAFGGHNAALVMRRVDG
ncbi:MAG: beta-ketoacyl-[acyl-carrier-protein] synthase family protein, partial [Acidiferrobacterales bacterium]